MNKIFALDLGTNSIGWALRNPDLIQNQIEKFGVITFNKGVGIGKTGEYSYAAERTKKRSTRRLYQARKYRLWATLEHLIIEGYCPLNIDNLNKWRHYNKEEARKNNNGGRVYPVEDLAFDAWIKLDFNGDGKPDYQSPYQLRKDLTEIAFDLTNEKNRYKIGRALYHIAQRRGFKSSRKGAENVSEKEDAIDEVVDLQYSEKKKNKVINDFFDKYPEAKTIGASKVKPLSLKAAMYFFTVFLDASAWAAMVIIARCWLYIFSIFLILLMLIVKLAMLYEGVFALKKMVTSTAFATRLGWSISPGMPWSVSPGMGGQLAPEWSGHIHQNLHNKNQGVN